mmetsp:Transcript_56828/g.126718  ORF Transcript_56828/g.126718 Transcript_56828/m.126718 type:complete len:317 (-) Transcript_56828:99-1049(-)
MDERPTAASAAWQRFKSKLPDKALLVSGAVGGPFVIFLATPLRNGLTLGAQDKRSGIIGLYRKVFRGGPSAGWTGGLAPALVACPQFLALGPIYHFMKGSVQELTSTSDFFSSAVASLGAALCETTLTFGSQARNAQMAYNNSFVHFASVADGSRKNVPLTRVRDVWGPGAEAMLLRNFLSVMAVRSLSPWLRERVPGESRAKGPLCDVASSLLTCTITAPVHQLFNFLATTPDAKLAKPADRLQMARRFLREQYFVPLPREVMLTMDIRQPLPQQEYSWKISRVALRDFGMRSVYITTIFSLFVGFERTLCSWMR